MFQIWNRVEKPSHQKIFQQTIKVWIMLFSVGLISFTIKSLADVSVQALSSSRVSSVGL